MRYLWLLLMNMAIVAVSCNGLSVSKDQAINASKVITERNTSLVAIPDSALELYSYDMPDGKVRVFFELMGEYGLNLYTMTSNEGEPRKVELCYDRYHDGENFLADGWWTPLYYTMSPDGRSLYVVTRMHANSNGWVTEYQLFKIDCESLDARLLAECAAIEVTERGFTTAIARLTNKNKAQFTYQEVWLMHDQRIDWNGNIAATSRKEYNYKQMVKRFAADAKGYKLVKGFKN